MLSGRIYYKKKKKIAIQILRLLLHYFNFCLSKFQSLAGKGTPLFVCEINFLDLKILEKQNACIHKMYEWMSAEYLND